MNLIMQNFWLCPFGSGYPLQLLASCLGCGVSATIPNAEYHVSGIKYQLLGFEFGVLSSGF